MTISPDIQATFDYLFSLAEKALSEGRSFAPFATGALVEGGRTHSTADLNAAASTPQEHMIALIGALKDQAARGAIKSAGLAFDTVAPFSDGKASDAVCVHAETAAGEAVQIFVPYERARSVTPAFAEPVVQTVAARIFTAR
jgi:hypothetical protein